MGKAFFVIALMGCVSSRHAEVRVANNQAGADCFSRCVAGRAGGEAVDCVAACPGGAHERGPCDDASLTCVEDRHMRNGINTLLVLGSLVGTIVLLSAANSGGGM